MNGAERPYYHGTPRPGEVLADGLEPGRGPSPAGGSPSDEHVYLAREYRCARTFGAVFVVLPPDTSRLSEDPRSGGVRYRGRIPADHVCWPRRERERWDKTAFLEANEA